MKIDNVDGRRYQTAESYKDFLDKIIISVEFFKKGVFRLHTRTDFNDGRHEFNIVYSGMELVIDHIKILKTVMKNARKLKYQKIYSAFSIYQKAKDQRRLITGSIFRYRVKKFFKTLKRGDYL